MSATALQSLTSIERQALVDLVQQLQEQFADMIQAVVLFGSKARGEATQESDIDVLIVVDNDDWQLHKQITFLAVDISLKYDLFELSPRVWSVSHLRQMAAIPATIYRDILAEGINLLYPAQPPLAELLPDSTPVSKT